ncbi:MAG: STAS domain-containing protein, partial [Bacteroidota bacterium]
MKQIVLDLERVPLMDSTGIGQLISSYTAIQNAEGKLVLASLQPKTTEVLKITRLYDMFTVTETVNQATEFLK